MHHTELLALPAPALYISTVADSLSMKEKRGGWNSKSMRGRLNVGDYVGMIGLLALSCGKLVAAYPSCNAAVVEWYDVLDPKIWGQRYIPCYCRYTDLDIAYPNFIAKAKSIQGGA